ncbi:Stress-response A/B barrel domain-containing protein UP3 [Sesamum alatum]|uniref:Stress-response A/B barrel domain-containing protein UP3 n=1 Tax=Sesamum alatum TaxID=300844 RepID=A0AAE2CSG1_9LAMI|nr:Stress-response A/B barrel domain-containing protein UP3 [Sesamum alatum]
MYVVLTIDDSNLSHTFIHRSTHATIKTSATPPLSAANPQFPTADSLSGPSECLLPIPILTPTKSSTHRAFQSQAGNRSLRRQRHDHQHQRPQLSRLGPPPLLRSDFPLPVQFPHLHSHAPLSIPNQNRLTAYAENPIHLSVISNYIKPIIEDIMAVDWVAEEFSGPADVPPGSALRLTILKLKEGAGESGKSEVLRVVSGIRENFPWIGQLTAGENFSPGRAKGFSIGSIAVFKGMKELEELDSESELAYEQNDKFGEFVDGVLVLDYAVAVSVETASV